MLLALKISTTNARRSRATTALHQHIHGDETTDMILMMRLIDYLLLNYSIELRISNNMEVYISPNTSPDGTYYSGNHTVSGSRRANANGQDQIVFPVKFNISYQPGGN